VVLLDDMDRDIHVMGEMLEFLGHGGREAQKKMIIVGTVNAISRLDPALLRPGRFDEVLHVQEPEPAYLRKVIQFYAEKYGVSLDLETLLEDMKGFAPADVREVMVSTGIVGADVYSAEVARVRRQRALHSGSRCEEYFASKGGAEAPSPSPSPSSDPL
jgi:ATP-dependent 26S proteasome regulatory subunit